MDVLSSVHRYITYCTWIDYLDRDMPIVCSLWFAFRSCCFCPSCRRFFCVSKGTILLAVNPLKAVPTPSIEDFKDHPLDPEMPHPYAIAEVWYGCVYYCIVLYGIVWYGMVWYGMVLPGMLYNDMVWQEMPHPYASAEVWYGCVCYCMGWYGIVWYGIIWCGMVWCDVVWWYAMPGMIAWCGMRWYGMAWYGMVWVGVVGHDMS